MDKSLDGAHSRYDYDECVKLCGMFPPSYLRVVIMKQWVCTCNYHLAIG